MVVLNDPLSADTFEIIRDYMEHPWPPYNQVEPLDLFHIFYSARPYSAYWTDLGIATTVPYGVVFDRDGYIRLINNPTPSWPQILEQLCGVYTP